MHFLSLRKQALKNKYTCIDNNFSLQLHPNNNNNKTMNKTKLTPLLLVINYTQITHTSVETKVFNIKTGSALTEKNTQFKPRDTWFRWVFSCFSACLCAF